MNTANEKFSAINLDLVGRVLPRPTGRLLVADLLQMVGKLREPGGGNNEVEIPPVVATVADFLYPVILRRRRR